MGKCRIGHGGGGSCCRELKEAARGVYVLGNGRGGGALN